MTAVPSTEAVPGPRRVFRLPLLIAFVGYPFLWLLGLGGVAWPAAAAVAVLLMLRRRVTAISVPWPMLIWFAFLGWMLVSAVGLGDAGRLLAFTYRAIMYASATVMFLYVYNLPRHLLPDRAIVKSLAIFWVSVTIGGLVGVVRPTLEIVTVAERFMPAAALDNALIYNLVHVEFASVSRFLGYPVGRPEALFPFTNAWGSNFALLLPMLMASWVGARARWHVWSRVLLVVSVVPVILSLNRGLWLTAILGLGYAVIRLVLNGRARSVAGLIVMGALLGGTIVALGLGGLVTDRAETGHSDQGRASLYSQSVELAMASPWMGYGAPQPNADDPSGPSVGTHGQFWLVLVSQGFPGAALYVGFMVALLWTTRRWDTDVGIWSQTLLAIATLQLLIYEQLPSQLQITMVVAAMSLRALAPRPPRPVSDELADQLMGASR